MTFKRSSTMILIGGAALVALAGCAPTATSTPQGAAAQAMPSADVPITDQEKAEIQAGLNKLGYSAGDVDGFIGRQSREAIRSFQADIGAAADGFYSPALVERVRAEAGDVTIAAQPAAIQAPAPKKPAPAKPAPTTVAAPAAPAAQPVVVRPAPEPEPEPAQTYFNEVGGDSGGGGGGGGGGDGGGGW